MIDDMEIGVAVMTTYVDGFLGIQVDAYGEAQSGLGPSEGRYPFGHIGRPLDAVEGRGAGVLRMNEGGAIECIALDDPRDRPVLPKIKKGSSAMYNSRGAFLLFDYENANVIGYYPNKAKTRAIFTTHDPEAGEASMVNVDGAYVLMKTGEGITLMSANGQNWIKVDDDGVTISGQVKVLGGMVVGNPATALPVLVGLSGPAGVGSAIFKASPTP